MSFKFKLKCQIQGTYATTTMKKHKPDIKYTPVYFSLAPGNTPVTSSPGNVNNLIRGVSEISDNLQNFTIWMPDDGTYLIRAQNGLYVSTIQGLLAADTSMSQDNLPALEYQLIFSEDTQFSLISISGYVYTVKLSDPVMFASSSEQGMNYPQTYQFSWSDITPSLATIQQTKTTGGDLSWLGWPGVDLSGVNMDGVNIQGADLTGAIMAGASLIKANLQQAILSGIDFTVVVSMEGADLTAAILSGAIFSIPIRQAVMPRTKFATGGLSTNLDGINFDKVNLTGAILIKASLNATQFKGSTLSGADLTGCNLMTIGFDEMTVIASTAGQWTILNGATLPYELINRNWQWIDLRNSTVGGMPQQLSSDDKQLQATGVMLSGLNQNSLTGVCLEKAVLDNAILDKLDLSGATLTEASLIDASMHDTNLTNSKLIRAKLNGAQLGSLAWQFTLDSSLQSALDSGNVSALQPIFSQHGITFSSTASLSTKVAGRVWELNDVGNRIIYTIRLETQTDNTQVLTVYGPAIAASLVNAYMPDAVLTGANLYGVLASSVQFYGSKALIDGSAILEEAQLNDSNLSNLNLTQAQLLGANLSGAQLFGAKFNRANLSPSADGVATNLSNANLQGADFTDAQLYGANLANAAVAVNVPTKSVPNQGGVYLFSLPYRGDSTALQQYTSELNAAATQFSLNPDGDSATLQKYVTALETNDLTTLQLAFLKQQPPITLSSSAQIETIEQGSVWQIVDGAQSYTLWEGVDENDNTQLYVEPTMTNTQAAFHHNNMNLRWQASASIDTDGEQWLIDNDSENPQNFDLGYVSFILKLNGSVLDVYGSAVRIERLGDNNQLQIDTETCNVTTLDQTNMSGDTVCPNGVTLNVNQAQSGESWDVKWLRAATPPAPPTCVPTDRSWCPPSNTGKEKGTGSSSS